jgi:hypothetical protein
VLLNLPSFATTNAYANDAALVAGVPAGAPQEVLDAAAVVTAQDKVVADALAARTAALATLAAAEVVPAPAPVPTPSGS